MKSIWNLLFLYTILFFSVNINAQITIDGNFSDWASINSYVTDANNDNGGANKDLVAGYYTVDGTTLYIKTDVAGTFQPVDWTDYYIIYIDTDRSTGTGLTNGWWTMGADYRIVIFNSVQYLQVFMGTSQSDDTWGWGGTVGNNKPISARFSGSSCELAVLFSDLGVTSSNSIWLQWRAEPGTDAMPAFSDPRTDAPLSTIMKVLVPAYFSPSDANYWSRLSAQAAKMPGRLFAIANPENGPGSQYDTNYARVINNMHINQGKVIGYVSTRYGDRAIDLVKADIDAWYQFYPSIDGIFLDEQSNVAGKEPYYSELYYYIKQKNSTSLVVTNPGTNTLESYLFYNGKRIADVICIFESSKGFDSWTPASWCSKYSRDNFYVLPYNTTESQYVSRVNKAASLNVGWIYFTDDTGDNPWDTLPVYFENFCNYIVTGIYTPTTTNTSAKIQIDGKFNDWQDIIPLNISQGLIPSSYSDSSANIKNVWATLDSSSFYISFQVSSKFDYSKYFYHVFIDVDNDSISKKTGFVYKDSASIGAEFMIENNSLWKYTGTGGRNWSWNSLSGMQKIDSVGRTELSIPLKNLINNSSKIIRFFIEINQAIAPYDLVSTAPKNYKGYFYKLEISTPTKIYSKELPQDFILYQNYPNPFNPSTIINYQIPLSGKVTLKIYDILGREVATLVDEYKEAGLYNYQFSISNYQLSSGVYIYQLQSGNFIQRKKFILMK